MSKRKRCPHCGSDKTVMDGLAWPNANRHWVICYQCGSTGPVAQQKRDAEQAWNRRGGTEK